MPLANTMWGKRVSALLLLLMLLVPPLHWINQVFLRILVFVWVLGLAFITCVWSTLAREADARLLAG